MASAIPTNTYTISDSNSGLYATSPPQVGMDVYWSQESKADNQKWLITDDGSGNATIKSVAYNIEAWCKEPAQEGEDVTLSKAKRVWVINVTKSDDDFVGPIELVNTPTLYWAIDSKNDTTLKTTGLELTFSQA